VHDRCVAIDAPVPDFTTVTYDALNGGDGRWVFTIREPGRRRFTVRVPPPRSDRDDVVVLLHMTAAGRRP
jgi:hypothetical protein